MEKIGRQRGRKQEKGGREKESRREGWGDREVEREETRQRGRRGYRGRAKDTEKESRKGGGG